MGSCFLHSRKTIPWIIVVLSAVCLLLAEHHSPSDILYGSSTDFVVESNKSGNLTRQVCYLIVGTIGMLSFSRAEKHRLQWKNSLLIVLAALLVWGLFCVSIAQQTFSSVSRMAVLLIALFASFRIVSAWSREAVVKLISLSLALQLSVGLTAELYLGTFRPWDSSYRFSGTLYWNQEGLLCLFLALASCTSAISYRQGRWWSVLLAGYGTVFMLLTKSRSSLVGLIVAMLLYWLLATRGVKKCLIGFLAGTLVCSILIVGAADPLLRLVSRDGEGSSDLTGRVPVWEECLAFYAQRPLAGYGFEDFWTPQHIDYFSTEFHWSISSAHSAYIEALLNMGAVGLFLHVSVLVIGFGRAVGLYRDDRSPEYLYSAALFAIYLVVGLLEAILIVKSSPVSFYFDCSLWFVLIPPTTSRNRTLNGMHGGRASVSTYSIS